MKDTFDIENDPTTDIPISPPPRRSMYDMVVWMRGEATLDLDEEFDFDPKTGGVI